MATAGPQLPSHLLAKRKRQDEAQEDISECPPSRSRSSSNASDKSADKRRRIIGPSAPPAPLSEIPSAPDPDSENSSSDDDDFGPSLPPAQGSLKHIEETHRQQTLADEAAAQEAARKPAREEWMLAPPTHGELSARADPTKVRQRKFNTGKGSRAPIQKGEGDNALWTETPEQKRQRLEDEVLGVKKPAQMGPDIKKEAWKVAEAKETERKIREYHQRKKKFEQIDGESDGRTKAAAKKEKEKEDDPSKRAFDKEKDLGVGPRIGHAQKREMLNRAKDFGSRFEGGSYL